MPNPSSVSAEIYGKMIDLREEIDREWANWWENRCQKGGSVGICDGCVEDMVSVARVQGLCKARALLRGSTEEEEFINAGERYHSKIEALERISKGEVGGGGT